MAQWFKTERILSIRKMLLLLFLRNSRCTMYIVNTYEFDALLYMSAQDFLGTDSSSPESGKWLRKMI